MQLHGRPVYHGLGLAVGHILAQLEELDKGLLILLMVGLVHALGHGVVEVRHALAAVHLVLVCLDGYTGQGRVASYVLGLPEVAVAGGEAVFKELDKVDLTAGLRKGVEVLVVNVDVALGVGL